MSLEPKKFSELSAQEKADTRDAIRGYKVYTQLLRCSAPADITEGMLTVGDKYRIKEYHTGDDFTNCGAASNATNVIFVCTESNPNIWTNGSVIECLGIPYGEVLEDTITGTEWQRNTVGIYRLFKEGGFPPDKIFVFLCGTGGWIPSVDKFQPLINTTDPDFIQIDTDNWDGLNTDFGFSNLYFEVRVYL